MPTPEELFLAKLDAWKKAHPEPDLEDINAEFDRRMAANPWWRLAKNFPEAA